VTLIVDGYNLYFTGLRPGSAEGDLEHARATVVDALAQHRAGRAVKVIIFFDGGPAGKHMPRVQREKGMEIRFSEPVSDADEDIIRAVAQAPNPAALRVVTSDAQIRKSVKEAGAQVIGAEEFAEELSKRRGAQAPLPRDEPRAKYVGPTPAEVDYWLRTFARRKDKA
jgi:predicted RNA-binding protein with PIN domain